MRTTQKLFIAGNRNLPLTSAGCKDWQCSSFDKPWAYAYYNSFSTAQ